MRNDRRDLERFEQRLAERERGNTIPPETRTPPQMLTAMRTDVTRSRRFLCAFGALLLPLAGMFFVDVSRISFETATVVHFQQALKIASPYLTDTDRAMVESKFAQIHSKSEYVAIVDDLAKTAKEHGQTVPPFTDW